MNGHLSNLTGIQPWQWVFGGFTTVCGFFLISGFSVAASITARPEGFYNRRIRRLYPLSITAVIVAVIATMWATEGRSFDPSIAIPPFKDLFYTALLLNGLMVMTPSILRPLWSLNCEVFYYVTAPILIRLPTMAISVFIFLSLVFFIAPLSHHSFYNYGQSSHGVAIISLFWIWLLGFLAYRYLGSRWIMFAVIGGGSILLAQRALSEAVLALPVFVIVATCVTALPYIRMPEKWVKFANYLGELSYPLYVLHYSVLLLAWRIMEGRSQLLNALFVWVGSIVVAILAYHGIDRQFRKPRRIKL